MKKRGPQPIADVLSELMARRGFAAKESAEALQDAWQAAAGEVFGPHSRAVRVRGGTLEVMVANNLLIQELTFQKVTLLRKINEQLPETPVSQIRFRVGKIA